MKAHERIVFALDVPTAESAIKLIHQLHPYVGYFKVGLELFIASWSERVRRDLGAEELLHAIPPGKLILDLKLHDIPETVERAIRAAAKYKPAFITLHVQQRETLERAVRVAAEENVRLLGVTVLTSMNDDDLDQLALGYEMSNRVKHLVQFAIECGLTGFVCSPKEVADLKKIEFVTGEGDEGEIDYAQKETPFLMVPGIRPEKKPAKIGFGTYEDLYDGKTGKLIRADPAVVREDREIEKLLLQVPEVQKDPTVVQALSRKGLDPAKILAIIENAIKERQPSAEFISGLNNRAEKRIEELGIRPAQMFANQKEYYAYVEDGGELPQGICAQCKTAVIDGEGMCEPCSKKLWLASEKTGVRIECQTCYDKRGGAVEETTKGFMSPLACWNCGEMCGRGTGLDLHQPRTPHPDQTHAFEGALEELFNNPDRGSEIVAQFVATGPYKREYKNERGELVMVEEKLDIKFEPAVPLNLLGSDLRTVGEDNAGYPKPADAIIDEHGVRTELHQETTPGIFDGLGLSSPEDDDQYPDEDDVAREAGFDQEMRDSIEANSDHEYEVGIFSEEMLQQMMENPVFKAGYEAGMALKAKEDKLDEQRSDEALQAGEFIPHDEVRKKLKLGPYAETTPIESGPTSIFNEMAEIARVDISKLVLSAEAAKSSLEEVKTSVVEFAELCAAMQEQTEPYPGARADMQRLIDMKPEGVELGPWLRELKAKGVRGENDLLSDWLDEQMEDPEFRKAYDKERARLIEEHPSRERLATSEAYMLIKAEGERLNVSPLDRVMWKLSKFKFPKSGRMQTKVPNLSNQPREDVGWATKEEWEQIVATCATVLDGDVSPSVKDGYRNIMRRVEEEILQSEAMEKLQDGGINALTKEEQERFKAVLGAIIKEFDRLIKEAEKQPLTPSQEESLRAYASTSPRVEETGFSPMVNAFHNQMIRDSGGSEKRTAKEIVEDAFGKGVTVKVDPTLPPGWVGATTEPELVGLADDQKRVGTPRQAILDGADLLVIGRPIRDAADPIQAAKNIAKEIEEALEEKT